jgi:hypothetical protein
MPAVRQDSAPSRRRLDHLGSCGHRSPCWRQSCRERFGRYSTVEYVGGEVIAWCHREKVRAGSPGPWRAAA